MGLFGLDFVGNQSEMEQAKELSEAKSGERSLAAQ